MAYLIDTNILLRLVSPRDPMHPEAVAAIDTINERRQRLVIAPQNLIEFWNVSTRPAARNGFGFSTERTQAELNRLKHLFILLPDTPSIYPEWERLVATYEVKGTKVHDTRLVAFMLVYRISHLLTFNVRDFQRFEREEKIVPTSPQQVIES